MPLPLLYLVPGLITAGAAAWEWLRPEKDAEWRDKAVFNDRMRQIQSAILDLNTALASCAKFMANRAQLTSWRTFRTNWSKFYGETGSLVYFGPNDAQIANAKQYTNQLAKWVDVLKTYPECVGSVPVVLPPPASGAGQTPSPSADDDDSISLPGLLIFGGFTLLFLMSKRE